ncbi:putative short-chain dehydrogenase [Stipitochalara longipes BDJ]|nr:putative short-chain dehydrogenase [Stipitochalara longipes BDJ]
MSSPPVLLLFGCGSRIGASVAEAFKAKGYNLALVSRTIDEETSTSTELHIKADLSDPSVVPKIFEKVKDIFGSPPSVVIYNAYSRTLNDPANPLDISLPQLEHDTRVNTHSPLVAASLAIKGFASLPSSSAKTFIFTGNMLNEVVNPACLGFGMGKSSTAHLISMASLVYSPQGMKFYYADERKVDGMPAMAARSGPAHAKFYIWLAEQKEQGPWRATFVDGVYQSFPVVDRLAGQDAGTFAK